MTDGVTRSGGSLPANAENLFSDFLTRLQRGEPLDIDELCRKHPDIVPVHELGSGHPNTPFFLYNLGSVLYPTGALEEAQAILREALETARRLKLAGHRLEPNILKILGETLTAAGSWREAEGVLLERQTIAAAAHAADPEKIKPLREAIQALVEFHES